MSVSGEMEESRAKDFRAYATGFALAVVLTVLSFAVALTGMFGTVATFAALAVLALLQVGVHLRYFLHIDFSRQKREDLQLILFTVLIITLMAAGTLWILADLMRRMG